MPDLRQAGRAPVPAVLLEALRRRRPQPLALRDLYGAGGRRRREVEEAGGAGPGLIPPGCTISSASHIQASIFDHAWSVAHHGQRIVPVNAGVSSKLSRSISTPEGKSAPVRGQRTIRVPTSVSLFYCCDRT